MENSNVVMCQFQQSLWQTDKRKMVLAEFMAERQEENKEEKKAQSNLYAIHAKHVITIPKDVQLTGNTHGESHNKPNMTSPLLMMRLKAMRQ